MIAESFDRRTLANMEVALDRACKVLATGSQEHRAREHIAAKIIECAKGGDKTLGGLTEAGRAAASEFCAAPVNKPVGDKARKGVVKKRTQKRR
jgi:hypothetical protein